MLLRFDPTFRLEVLRAEADARGLSARLRDLADRHEADGLDPDDAALDAAEALGLGRELDAAVEDVLLRAGAIELEAPLASAEISNGFAEMPTLRHAGGHATITLPASPIGELAELLGRLVDALAAQPHRTSVQLAVGLGGSGGCACGDDLPEDAPPGPLFAR